MQIVIAVIDAKLIRLAVKAELSGLQAVTVSANNRAKKGRACNIVCRGIKTQHHIPGNAVLIGRKKAVQGCAKVGDMGFQPTATNGVHIRCAAVRKSAKFSFHVIPLNKMINK